MITELQTKCIRFRWPGIGEVYGTFKSVAHFQTISPCMAVMYWAVLNGLKSCFASETTTATFRYILIKYDALILM